MAIATALVTGGAGFIGSHVVDRFVREGVRVVVVDDLSTGKRENVSDRAEFHEIDVCSSKTVELIQAVKPDAVFHFAAQKNVRYSLERPADDARINVVGSVTLLEAARRAGVKNFMFSSTGGAIYSDDAKRPTDETALARPLSPYGIAKRSFELYLDAYAEVYGMRTLALRLANVYGPRQDPKGEAGVVAIFLDAIRNNIQPSIFGNGEQTRDYVYVDDVVEACWQGALSQAQGMYNIGTGNETSVLELWNAIAGIAQTPVQPKHTDPISGELRWSALSAAAALKAFGWKPRIGLTEGLQKTYDWFKIDRPNPR